MPFGYQDTLEDPDEWDAALAVFRLEQALDRLQIAVVARAGDWYHANPEGEGKPMRFENPVARSLAAYYVARIVAILGADNDYVLSVRAQYALIIDGETASTPAESSLRQLARDLGQSAIPDVSIEFEDLELFRRLQERKASLN